MVTAKSFRALCLALPDASEAPHFDRAAFRTPQRIFATLAADGRTANLKLAPEQQELLAASRPSMFAPVDNGFGPLGWTTVQLPTVDEGALRDALGWAHAIAATTKKPKKKRRP